MDLMEGKKELASLRNSEHIWRNKQLGKSHFSENLTPFLRPLYELSLTFLYMNSYSFPKPSL
jgi:hypothetical protein